MNADVNIPLSVNYGHAGDSQRVNITSTERHNNDTDVTIVSTSKETTGESLCNLIKKVNGSHTEEDMQEITAATKIVPKTTKDWEVDAITNKVAKLIIKSGTWSCMCELCKDEDNDHMLSCVRCKGKRHYGCTNLPLYQVSLFVSKIYKKKFM